MSSVVISGNTSGTITLDAPAVAGTTTLTLPAANGTVLTTATGQTLTSPVIAGTPTGVGVLTSGTAVASTSGTSIDFTSIPSWVKRITVMFSGVSTNGTSNILLRLGDAGGIENTGYASGSSYNNADAANSTGFLLVMDVVAAVNYNGAVTFSKLDGNTYSSFGGFSNNSTAVWSCAGAKTLSDTLTQVRITTVNGTDTFDAGSINILFE